MIGWQRAQMARNSAGESTRARAFSSLRLVTNHSAIAQPKNADTVARTRLPVTAPLLLRTDPMQLAMSARLIL